MLSPSHFYTCINSPHIKQEVVCTAVLSRPLSQWGPLTDKYCPQPQLRWGAQAVTYSVSRSTNCTELLQVRRREEFYEIIKRTLHFYQHQAFMDFWHRHISSSLSISARIEEITHCSWHQLDWDHDKFSGQRAVFASGRHWLDAGRLGTRSWPVETLNRIILIAVFEGQQHWAINYPSIYSAQAGPILIWIEVNHDLCQCHNCHMRVNSPG